MDEVKRKVFLDLFGAPAVVLPVVGGITAFLLSWAMGGQTALNLAGLAGLLGGAGMFATRLIFGLEDLTHRAYQYTHDKQRQDQKQALDALDQKLHQDNDPRTEQSLRKLRQLYGTFQESFQSEKITSAMHDLGNHVERLFRACVSQLEQSYELWEVAQKLNNSSQSRLMAERETILQEVIETIDHLSRAIERFHTFTMKRSKTNLSELREELEETLRVARRTEERLANLDGKPTYTESEFE